MYKARIALISYMFPSFLVIGLVAYILFASKSPEFGLVLLFFGIPWILIRAWLIALTHKVELNDNNVEFRVGFLNKTTTTLRLRKIESVDVHQGIIGRLFNYGALKFSGTGGDKDFTPNIKDPSGFKQILQSRLDEIQA